MRFTRVFAFILAILIPSILYSADKLYFKNLSSLDGLPEGVVFGSAKDKYGFVWFATRNGMVRYDGYDFKIFKNVPNDSTSISSSQLNGVYCSPKGDLFALTEKGLNIYNYGTESFSRIHPVNDPDMDFSKIRVKCVFETDEVIWVGTLNGLYCYDRKNNYINHFKLKTGAKDIMSNEVRAINMDPWGNLWLGTFDGLYRFNPSDISFERYEARIKKTGDASNNLINSIYFSPNFPEMAFIGSSAGLIIADVLNPSKILKIIRKENGLSSNDIQGITEYEDGVFLLATSVGLSSYDIKTDRLSRYYSSVSDQTSLSGNSLRHIFKDNDGIIWISSDRGVSILNTRTKGFELFSLPSKTGHSNEGAMVYEILIDGDILWASTNEGIFKLDLSHGHSIISDYNLEKGLSHPIVKSLFMDSRGILWAGTNDGLDYYDSDADRFRKIHIDSGSFALKYVYDINEDFDGNIIVNVTDGVCFITPAISGNNHVDSVSCRGVSIAGLSNTNYSDVGNITVDRKSKTIWFSSNSCGLFKYDPKAEDLRLYSASRHDDSGLSDNNIPSILCDSKGKTWLGTESGLYYYDSGKDIFIKSGISQIKGLVKSIHEDGSGNIWLTSGHNLIALDPADSSHRVLIWDMYERFKIMGFAVNCICEDKSGNMYLGCNDHILKFPLPETISHTDYPAPYITSFSVAGMEDGKNGIGSTLLLSKKVKLNYKENSFAISFSSLDFTSPASIAYDYILEGYDNQWQTTRPGENTVDYRRLRPGLYKFMVRASSSGQFHVEEAQTLGIKITPPFWWTWYFILLYVVLAILIILLVIKFIKDRMRLSAELAGQKIEREKLEILNHNKMVFFTNVSHEFKTPLSLITGPVEYLMDNIDNEKQQAHLKIIKQNSDRLKVLVEEIMDIRKMDSGKLQLSATIGDYISFARKIFDSFQYLSKKRNIQYEFNSEEPEAIFEFDAGKMEKVLYNLLSNAFKFTPDEGHISLSISKIIYSDGGEWMFTEVKDNGMGIPENEAGHIFERFYQGSNTPYGTIKGTGIGLVLTKDFVELHGGTIAFKSEDGHGTAFHFKIPANRVLSPNKKDESNADILGRKKIVVVEDNVDMQNFIKMNLETEFEVFLANNGRTGLDIIQKINPDIITTDIMMPDMDGYELCRFCKDDMVLSEIPIIMLTAKDDDESRSKGYDIGADAYISKPFSIKTLQSRIHALIKRREGLQEKFRKDFMSDFKNIPGNDEDHFIVNIVRAIEANLENSDFGIEQLCEETKYSYQQIYRKVKAVTGETIGDFIRSVRLKKAAQLMSVNDSDIRVSDIMFKVGFNTHSYFTKCFREKYGMTPKEYIAHIQSKYKQ